MKTISGKNFVKLLEQHGWELVRVKGSHHIYAKDGFVGKLTVPVHGGKDLKIGLLKVLMKIAGINEVDL